MGRFCCVVFAFMVLINSLVASPIPEISAPAAICNLPPQRGHCRALLPRWRYDPASGRCAEFKFGGCDGNGNNFQTERDCMKMCAGI